MPNKYNKYSERKSADNTDYPEIEAEVWESDRPSDEKEFIKQVQLEFKEAKDALLPKIQVWQKRLKLLNNQKRSEKKIGEPLMFTIFQTVIASLYTDKLEVVFEGREEGDDEVGENLTFMAKVDYDDMDMALVKYWWIWDAAFFGRGLVLLNEFNRRKLHPIPEVLDPLTFLRDPNASSVNGLNGVGAMRFGGNHTYLTDLQIKSNDSFFNTDKLDKGKKNNTDQQNTETDIDEVAAEARRARAEAQDRQIDTFGGSQAVGDNKEHKILRWFTHVDGYKCVAFFTKDWDLIRFHYLVDDEGESLEVWPIADRPIYLMSHDWDSVSVPDLTEDKQRMMSILENLIIEAGTAQVYPMHVYNKQIIKNPNDLNFEFNKFVGVDGNPVNAVVPLVKDSPNQILADYILRMLDTQAQKATATPEIQQGRTSSEIRTLGELNIVASKVDTRNSLTLKIFGVSEKFFWRLWYWTYKKHFDKHIDEKVIRIKGAFGTQWRTLGRENIVALVDPDVEVESVYESEGRRMREMQEYDTIMGVVLQDPDANKRYAMKRALKLRRMPKDEIDRLLPPTAAELQAMRENEILSENRLADEKTQETVTIKPTDNHVVHLEIHAQAADTPATRAHIKAHKTAMMMQEANPALKPPTEQAPGTLPGQESAVSGAGMPGMNIGGTAPSQLAAPSSYQ